MKNLQEATERICELKGTLVTLDALMPAVIDALSEPARARLAASFDAHAEAARTVMLPADVSELVLATFERDVARYRAVLLRRDEPDRAATQQAPVEALLLTSTRVTPFAAVAALASASGFFFRRGERLFLVSDRRVFADAAGSPAPERIEFGLHTDAQDLTRQALVSLPLYRDGRALWRGAGDGDDAVDVAAIEIPAAQLPAGAVLHAFVEADLDARGEQVAIGDALAVPGFPPGVHDTIHHLPVVRSAALASAYGVPFRGRDCFLTDARLPGGSSGSPVVRRRLRGHAPAASLPWQLLGVHSSRLEGRADT